LVELRARGDHWAPVAGADIRRLQPGPFWFEAAEVERTWAVIAHCDGGFDFGR